MDGATKPKRWNVKVRLAAAALVFAAATMAPAQPPSAPPRLIVAISVDQFSADLFAQYRRHFTGGLGRLSGGAVFPSGYQSHASTTTCAGHATILTGARPSRSGIIANDWFDLGMARDDKQVYCAEDTRVPGSTSSAYTASPRHLLVPTLGDLMRRHDPRSRVVAVAGKDRSAMMMGGHDPSERWWWHNTAFIGEAGAAPPAAVAAINAEVATAYAVPRGPQPMAPVCEARRVAVTLPPPAGTVGEGRFEREGGDRLRFRASPELDHFTLELAERLRADMALGEGPATDLLAISLAATDYVGHRFGTQGPEMCGQLLALDAMLGAFFERLDAAGIDYVVMLTADHGGQDIPERANMQGGNGARADAGLRARNMGRVIGEQLGLAGPVLFAAGVTGERYIDRSLPEADRARVLEAAVAAYRAHPQIAAVFTRAEIAAATTPAGPPDAWTPLQRVRASWHPQRSGDFYIMLRPDVTPIPTPSLDSIATHSVGTDQDRRVPILFWRRGMAPFEQPQAIETVDIMPTLAALIGLPVAPGSIDGRCLDLDAGPASTCPQ
ncbi:MAG: alkaline phosphatase family protein [Sphingomonas sp.]|nr:alkaline phosphatase family protein [Sphingomonas sp.]